MRKLILIPFLCFCLLSCKSKKIDKDANISKKNNLPNLVIFLSDQHSYDMVGAYGNQQIITPNLDQLAKDGVLLNNAFSSQPVCTPFRGMLMSGMQPLKNGAFVNDVPLLPNKTKLLPEILKEKGYQIVATTPHIDSCMLSDFDITKKSAFVFGKIKPPRLYIGKPFSLCP